MQGLSVIEKNLTSHAPRQADNDAQVINLWLHGKAHETQRGYRKDLADFIGCVEKPFRFITLPDIQGYADHLEGRGFADHTRARKLASVKSLFTFAQKIGYIQFNPGAVVELPKIKNDLAERIMSEEEVQRMLALETNPRNHTLLKFMYASGARVSEVHGLSWKDLKDGKDGTGRACLFGKGGKTRYVLLPASVYGALLTLKPENAGDDAPVFLSRNHNRLSCQQINIIVKKAAVRAGSSKKASPHWMRHACASHALDRGAPIHVVQNTLGHENLATTGRYTHVKPTEGAGMYLAV